MRVLRVHEISARSREIAGSTLSSVGVSDACAAERTSVDVVANDRKTTISSRATGRFAIENEMFVFEISVPSLQEKRIIHSPYSLSLILNDFNDLSIDSERSKAVLDNAFLPIRLICFRVSFGSLYGWKLFPRARLETKAASLRFRSRGYRFDYAVAFSPREQRSRAPSIEPSKRLHRIFVRFESLEQRA